MTTRNASPTRCKSGATGRRPATALVATSLALAALGLAHADSGRSLSQTRSEMNSGTWAGITIYKSKPKAEPPAASASAPAAPAASAEVQKTTATPALESLGALLRLGDPPSGDPLNSAKRLDSPSLGIALPTASANAASAPPGKAR